VTLALELEFSDNSFILRASSQLDFGLDGLVFGPMEGGGGGVGATNDDADSSTPETLT